jgi:threonine dehydrogenase-like Zn-dependent dehydrogenase
MRAVCFEEIDRVSLPTIDDPVLESPSDAIARVRLAWICGPADSRH